MLDKSKRYLIVGLGLLGGKYALELTRAGFTVDGINRSETHLQYALDHGYIRSGKTRDFEDLIQGADHIIFGLYPTTLLAWFRQYGHLLKPGPVLHYIPYPSGKTFLVVSRKESIDTVLHYRRGCGSPNQHRRSPQGSRLTHNQRSVVIKRRKQEKVGGQIILPQPFPLSHASQETHSVIYSKSFGEFFKFTGRIACPYKEHSERNIFQQGDRMKQKLQILFHNMLPHIEEQRNVIRHAQFFSESTPFLLRIGAREIVSVVHHFHPSPVSVFAQGFLDRSLRNPHLISTVVKIDNTLDYQINYQPARYHTLKVRTIFRMECGDNGYAARMCQTHSQLSGRERTVRMQQRERQTVDLLIERKINVRKSHPVRLPLGNGHRHIPVHGVRNIVVHWRISGGSHHTNLFSLPVKPVRIILCGDRHPIHYGRKTVVK